MTENMTRVLYDLLPEQYRVADAEQSPALPLLRWLDGPGSILTRVRGVMDDAEAGRLLDPRESSIVRWTAALTGVSDAGLTDQEVRDAVASRLSTGAPYVGTRRHIGAAAMHALGEDAPLAVFPDPAEPWIIYVVTDASHIESAGGIPEVRRRIAAYGATPAGFAVIPVVATVTWEQFDAAKGGTWAEYVKLIRTWTDHDSLGVTLPGV